MSNEFKKLDQFMVRNRPEKKTPSSIPAFNKTTPKKTWIYGPAFAFGLASIITWSVINQQKSYDENALALSETLHWDVTSDEMPTEIEEVIDFSE